MEHQDWETAVIRKKAPKGNTRAAIGEAKLRGEAVETEKKHGGGSNRQSEAAVYARKLEEETEDFHHRHVGTEFRVALQQARTSKGWTQKQLAQRINEKQTVINEYENGTAIPNPQVIQKLQRALGVSLPKIPKKKKTEDE